MKAKSTGLTLALAFLGWVSLSGCGEIFGAGDCTLIGCDDGLRVMLDRPAPDGTVIRVMAAGDTTEVVCGERTYCADDLHFPGVLAPEVKIGITNGSFASLTEFRPVYSEVFPNGVECGPVCSQGKVRVSIPGAE